MFTRILALGLAGLMILGCVAMLAGCKKDPYANLSDAEYMQQVEKDNMVGVIATLTEFYGLLGKTDAADKQVNSNVDVSIQLGNMIVDMLEESFKNNTGAEMDFSFLSNIGMNMETAMKDNIVQEKLTVLLNNKQVISATMLMDLANSIMFLALPDLNKDFLKIDMDAMGGMGGTVMPDFGGSEELPDFGMTAGGSIGIIGGAETPDFGAGSAVMDPNAIMEMLPQIMEKLPSEEVFATLLNRYIDVILANLKNVTRSTVTLEEGGLKQTCTAVSTKIYLADVATIVEKLLDTAKNDQDLKKVIGDISALAGEDLYPAFQQGLEDFRESFNKSFNPEGGNGDADAHIELITYVDKDHNIIGRLLNRHGEDESIFAYCTISSGDKFAFKAEVQGIALTGNGTEKDGKTTATYTLSVSGTEYATLEVKDFKATDKDLTGNISVKPTASLLRLIFGGTSPVALADLTLEFQLATDSITTKVLSNNELIVSIGMKTKEATDGTVEMPSGALDADNPLQMQRWMDNTTFDTVLDNLHTAGVPSELIEMLTMLIFGGTNGGRD